MAETWGVTATACAYPRPTASCDGVTGVTPPNVSAMPHVTAPGFAKAVGGKFSDFKKWYDALGWQWKAPPWALGFGSELYNIWQMFH